MRLNDIVKFYETLDRLEDIMGGSRMLADCNGRMKWPLRGIYFFMQEGEHRSHSGRGARIVRVGTHALKKGSKTRLWDRLSQHKGQVRSGGGNHRGSIFRLIVGTALDPNGKFHSWGKGSSAQRETKLNELELERKVSQVIGNMAFLWLPVNDDPGPNSLRGYIERNSIALLSNYEREMLDPPSSTWLGHACNRERVQKSGLWNQNHVNENYDQEFLEKLESLVDAAKETI